jgi:heat shock protein HtpX
VSNVLETALLLVVLTVMLVLLGGAIGGRQGMLIAVILALAMNLGSYGTHRCTSGSPGCVP